MPLEIGLWRIDDGLKRIEPSKLSDERRLEDYIEQDITLVRSDLWVIGRQVPTAHGLGHVLLGNDHCEDTPAASECESRLMTQFPSPSTRELSESECEEARKRARPLSDRFDEYNQEFGPPNQHRFCCDVGEGPQFLPARTCFGGPQHPSQVHRHPSECAQAPAPPPEPEPDGGRFGGVVPQECCLVDGGLTRVDEGTCPAGQKRPSEECQDAPR